MNLKNEFSFYVYKQYLEPYIDQPLFSCSVQTLAPKSRGTITLNSSNPFDPPVIDPNYLHVPTDITDIVQGKHFYFKLLLINIHFQEILKCYLIKKH